jgi:hypothetical protein
VQHGVVGRAQLARLGLNRREVEGGLAAGRLHVLHRGVYAVGHRALTPYGHLVAALLAVGGDAVLSHGAAAFVWRLTDELVAPIDLVAAHRVRRPGLRAHRHDLAARERTRHGGPAGHDAGADAARPRRDDPADRLERLVGEAFALRRPTAPGSSPSSAPIPAPGAHGR